MATENAGNAKNGSAEIFKFDDERMRLRAHEIEMKAFDSAGAYLAAVRKALDVSIPEIAEKVHIKPAFLEAIEDSDRKALPSKPFAIGFVKSYAEALGLDAKPIVEKFKEDVGYEYTPEVERAIEAAEPASEPTPQRRDMPLIAVIAVFLFIIWCGYQITRPQSVETPFRLNSALTPGDEAVGGAEVPALGAPGAPLPVVVEPRSLEAHDPVYPTRCEAGAKAEERVEVAFTVKVDGGVAGERVIGSSNDCFERASLNAIRRWRFEPRTVDGEPRAAYEQTVTFIFNRPL